MPRITMLHIEHSHQLHSAVSHRYRDVQDIYIYSLIEFEHEGTVIGIDRDKCILNEDTATRAVPFLCNFNSRRLERVFLGGRRPSSGRVEGFIPRRFRNDDDAADRMRGLIDAFSGAFRSGSLSANLWIAGLRCPNSSRRPVGLFDLEQCPTCHNACKSFPLESVIDFENEGRAEYSRMDVNDARVTLLFDENIFGLDVCLTRDEIEQIIRGRPGGKEMLLSDTRLMTLLGRGLRHVIVTDDDTELYVVKFDEEDMEEIQQFIKDSSLNVANLRPNEVVDAIKRSFAGDERDEDLPPREQCYLAESSFNALKDLGLPIQESDFMNKDELGSGNKNWLRTSWRFS